MIIWGSLPPAELPVTGDSYPPQKLVPKPPERHPEVARRPRGRMEKHRVFVTLAHHVRTTGSKKCPRMAFTNQVQSRLVKAIRGLLSEPVVRAWWTNFTKTLCFFMRDSSSGWFLVRFWFFFIKMWDWITSKTRPRFRILAPAQRSAGVCPPPKTILDREPAARRIFFNFNVFNTKINDF